MCNLYNRRFKICFSALIALLFLLITLWASNLHFPVSSEKTLLQWFNVLCPQPKSNYIDSVLIIDTHYDKQLLMEYDVYKDAHNKIHRDSIGYVAATDRQDLINLLEFFSTHVNLYRYIVLDVSFDESLKQPNSNDTILYNLIKSMKRISFAKDSSPLADNSLCQKAGDVRYYVTAMESDFVKFSYILDGDTCLPLKMYKELTDRDFYNVGPLYLDQGLARGSAIITFDLTYDDIIAKYPRYDLHHLVKNGFSEIMQDSIAKYVLIGDFEEDRHVTYKNLTGEPGPIINFNAYLSLLNGHHRVSLWMILLLFMTFWFLAYNTIHQSEHTWFIMWVGYPAYMIFFSFIVYLLFNEVYDVLISTTLFYFLKTIIDSIKLKDVIGDKIKLFFSYIHKIISQCLVKLKKTKK